MKIIYVFLLGIYVFIQGAAFPIGEIIVARDCAVSVSSHPYKLHCLSGVPGLDKPLCFCTEKEQNDFVVSRKQTENRAWHVFQSQMIEHCSSRIVHSKIFCPGQNEPLESFLQRTEKKITHEIKNVVQDVDVHTDFNGIPWNVLRYILAVNLKMRILEPDDVLPKLAATCLDLAAQYKDIEMMFFAIDHGARKITKRVLFELLVQCMLQSPDERSVQVLKKMSDSGAPFVWPEYEWATHLLPDQVKTKLYIITRMHSDARDIVKAAFCIPVNKVLELREETPGAYALKYAALGLSDLQNCKGVKFCSVL